VERGGGGRKRNFTLLYPLFFLRYLRGVKFICCSFVCLKFMVEKEEGGGKRKEYNLLVHLSSHLRTVSVLGYDDRRKMKTNTTRKEKGEVGE